MPDLMTPAMTPVSKTLLGRILSAQSYYVFLLGLMPGFLLVFGSVLLGFGFFTAKAPEFARFDREVGYLAAPNWSLTYALFFPAALYLMTESLQGIAHALDCLHLRGMVRDRNMQVVSAPVVTESWIRGGKARTRLMMIFAVIIPATYSFAEWLPNNFLRLLFPRFGPAAATADYDWGLAAVMEDSGNPQWSVVARLANAAFDLLAFSTEGLLIAASFAFFLFILDLGRVLPGLGHDSVLFLVPDLRSADRRRGFEVFAEPLQKTLGVALFTYLILYCVRLEGVYMKSLDAVSLAAFVQSDIWSGVVQAANPVSGNPLASVFKQLFDTGDATVRGILAWFVAVLVFTCSLIVVVMTVQDAAIRARSRVNRYEQRSLFGGEAAAEQRSAALMIVWPLGYLKLSTVVVMMMLATCTLYFYRIGLFIAGFVATALLIRLMYRICKPSNRGGRVPVEAVEGP